MNTILTDDEIEDAWCKYGDEMGGADQSDALRIGREIEAAVLAKLARQEPVASVRTWHKNGDQHAELDDWGLGLASIPDGTHNLYAHPAPQQADRQRVPEGWSADPSAAAVELAKMVMSDCGLAVESRHDLLGRIADRISKFAAAPEAPAQASAVDERVEHRAALDDMRYAVRFAPSSAYWSAKLREFFGPDARSGIDALEKQLREARAALAAKGGA